MGSKDKKMAQAGWKTNDGCEDAKDARDGKKDGCDRG